MQLASKFGRNSTTARSSIPLNDDQLSAVAPSIFAGEKHSSRSDRYTYIPTIDVLRSLRKEGFSPFMVCQTRTRDENKRDHTKHMIRLRHASQIDGAEANEIILLNSHDGTSSYQMLAGVFRFVCKNGLVRGDTVGDIRIRHKGNCQSAPNTFHLGVSFKRFSTDVPSQLESPAFLDSLVGMAIGCLQVNRPAFR